MVKQDLNEQLYVGVDVGGTKIQASLIMEDGAIIASRRCRTPRPAPPERTSPTVMTKTPTVDPG